ncbi:MAG: class I SAM-dependent methyltransferase [Thermodesulfovibrionales bacterium]|jgi:2-polyprenyl-3-methyl-5-hydroxy-6-metoxy-1,4-benzoquinol methylase|nr:class I SAM-dependent methyltransferase [Thermodesulfovibrionales bacterium]
MIKNEVVAGNLFDKYGSRNPIVQFMMKNFISSFKALVSVTGAREIHEIGCGEGHLSIILAEQKKKVRASDFSKQVILKARENAVKNNVDIEFKISSIYDLTPEKDAAELIVCCECLEHLENPEKALNILSGLANPYLIISVPREPLWRLLNMVRFKYVSRLGNTPGHIQHWSKRSFLKLLSPYFVIVETRTPMPWSMALCRSTMSRPK